MSGITGYEYDVFLSYAQLDNKTTDEEVKGWVEVFYAHLLLGLEQRLGRAKAVNIYWDMKRIEGNVRFDDQIKEGLERTALLLCLNSPASIASDYCSMERRTFYSKAELQAMGLAPENLYRIIPVHMYQIPLQEWPIEYNGVPGFKLFEAEGEDEGYPLDVDTPAYIRQLRALVRALHKQLKDFPKDDAAPGAALHAAPSPPPPVQPLNTPKPPKGTLFMAAVSDGKRRLRRKLMIQLEQEGYELLTLDPAPLTTAEHRQQVKALLAQANASIHLFDGSAGREFDDDLDRFIMLEQARLALEAGLNPFMGLLPGGQGGVEEPLYQEFLDELEEGTLSEAAYALVHTQPSSLPREIEEYLQEQMAARHSPEAGAAIGEGSPFLVDLHFKDHSHGMGLRSWFNQQKVPHFLNPVGDEPGENLEMLQQAMGETRHLIVMYGQVPKSWVEARLKASLRLIVEQDLPVDQITVLLMPPQKSAADLKFTRSRLMDIQVLDNSASTTLLPQVEQHLKQHLKQHQSTPPQ